MKRFVGERRAIAAAVLAFYSFLYLLLMFNPPPGWERAMAAMSSVYAIGFFGVVAGYFWARWYAIGLGLQGVITTAVSLWQLGPEPIFLFIGATHAMISLAMWGDGIADAFDGRKEWRTRFHLDEHAVHRLGRSVIRIGISLPYILLYALAPRGADAVADMIALGALALAVGGTWGLFRMRTWGLVALAGATAMLTIGAFSGAAIAPAGAVGVDLSACAAVAALVLGAALVPFARPVIEYLRRR